MKNILFNTEMTKAILDGRKTQSGVDYYLENGQLKYVIDCGYDD